MIDIEASLAAFTRGAVDVIDADDLRRKLSKGRPLRVKFGMDPSSPDLHVGHSIPLLKLRDLQRLGHQIVLIVGDATAMVGDPTGRNSLRPQLTREQVEQNLETYVDQARLVLDMERTEVRRNSEWFDALDFGGLLSLLGRATVAQMLERDTFATRMKANEPIGVHELLYPILQGWDSVEVQADVELGGTDQLFNLLFGRTLQDKQDMPPQVCITTPLINGTDGRKMSKSYGNSIALTDAANDMFGKVMSITDEVMEVWFTQLTRLAPERIAELLGGHPREAKATLAAELVRTFHDDAAADGARAAFDRQFVSKELPDEIPEVAITAEWQASGLPLTVLLREAGLCSSSSEARRLIQQGGVRLDGDVVKEPKHLVPHPAEPLLVQVGKRRFARVTRG